MHRILAAGLILFASANTGYAADNCSRFHIDLLAHQALAPIDLPPDHVCKLRMSKSGYPLPDPSCTPGAVNPTVTAEILRDPKFRTTCVRDAATSAHAKIATYSWYQIPKPKNNTGQTQTCELDHVVSLGLGGADTLDNIFPQCGPPRVSLNHRYFKMKDKVEDFLIREVRANRMDPKEAQHGIAEDWTQYLERVQ